MDSFTYLWSSLKGLTVQIHLDLLLQWHDYFLITTLMQLQTQFNFDALILSQEGAFICWMTNESPNRDVEMLTFLHWFWLLSFVTSKNIYCVETSSSVISIKWVATERMLKEIIQFSSVSVYWKVLAMFFANESMITLFSISLVNFLSDMC